MILCHVDGLFSAGRVDRRKKEKCVKFHHWEKFNRISRLEGWKIFLPRCCHGDDSNCLMIKTLFGIVISPLGNLAMFPANFLQWKFYFSWTHEAETLIWIWVEISFVSRLAIQFNSFPPLPYLFPSMTPQPLRCCECDAIDYIKLKWILGDKTTVPASQLISSENLCAWENADTRSLCVVSKTKRIYVSQCYAVYAGSNMLRSEINEKIHFHSHSCFRRSSENIACACRNFIFICALSVNGDRSWVEWKKKKPPGSATNRVFAMKGSEGDVKRSMRWSDKVADNDS